jgi:hypothetical protein
VLRSLTRSLSLSLSLSLTVCVSISFSHINQYQYQYFLCIFMNSWIIAALRVENRVLVHCGGLNVSTTTMTIDDEHPQHGEQQSLVTTVPSTLFQTVAHLLVHNATVQLLFAANNTATRVSEKCERVSDRLTTCAVSGLLVDSQTLVTCNFSSVSIDHCLGLVNSDNVNSDNTSDTSDNVNSDNVNSNNDHSDISNHDHSDNDNSDNVNSDTSDNVNSDNDHSDNDNSDNDNSDNDNSDNVNSDSNNDNSGIEGLAVPAEKEIKTGCVVSDEQPSCLMTSAGSGGSSNNGCGFWDSIDVLVGDLDEGALFRSLTQAMRTRSRLVLLGWSLGTTRSALEDVSDVSDAKVVSEVNHVAVDIKDGNATAAGSSS